MSAVKPSVTLVLPAYNEAAILTNHLEVLCDYMETLGDRYTWDMLIVNDGSTDQTGDLAEDFASTRSNVRVLHHFRNFRLGQALRYAFDNSRGDYVVTFDVDLSYSPDHIGRLLEVISRTRARIVVASPYMRGGSTAGIPFVRRTASRAANWFLSLASKSRIRTITGMVRAYDRRFLSTLNLTSTDAAVNAEVIYKAELLGAHMEEIPAHLDWTSLGDRRPSGISLRRTTAAFAFSGFIFRPFMAFILPGLILLVLALYTLGWAAYHIASFYPETTGGFDPRISAAVAAAFDKSPHSFVVGGLALIVAVQLLSLGVLSAQNKRYFEELFQFETTINRRLQDANHGHLTNEESARIR